MDGGQLDKLVRKLEIWFRDRPFLAAGIALCCAPGAFAGLLALLLLLPLLLPVFLPLVALAAAITVSTDTSSTLVGSTDRPESGSSL